MELKTVLLTILKILVSTVLIVQLAKPGDGAVLMGGHMDNKNHTEPDFFYDDYEYGEGETFGANKGTTEPKTDSEEIPNPSPLVLPGYNLPETIFNHGKPFYVEKDPVTGTIDFSNKSPSAKLDEGNLYDYVEDAPSGNIYDKKNINRKDGSLASYNGHKPSDVNQLTPNFHDYLNLPVKYNPDKYVYPLISSSYSSTKYQGSVNKFHNHKDTFGVHKTTTTTTRSPFQTSKHYTFSPRTTQRTMATTPVTTTTTTTKPTTVKRYPELTVTPVNLLNSGMSHPSFTEEFEYYDSPETTATTTTRKSKPPNVKNEISTTPKAPTTTTARVLSLFEQLFGDFEDTVSSTTKLPSQKSSPATMTTTKATPTSSTGSYHHNSHGGPSKDDFTGSDNSYEYVDEDYSEEKVQDNVAVENKVQVIKAEDNLSVEPLKPTTTKLTPVNNTRFVNTPTEKPITSTLKTTTTTATTPRSTTTLSTTQTTTTMRVTSLPLGENHINKDPIIVATQNLRQKLDSEKVTSEPPQLVVELPRQPQEQNRPFTQPVPSSSNIHIAPGQDTISFVVGKHQSVGDGGQYVGTAVKENPYDGKPFRPLHEPPYKTDTKAPGIAVTIQPLQNSEASLTIGIPVNGIKQVPGQVIDDSLDSDGGRVQFPKGDSSKVVFPEEANQKPPKVETAQAPPSREVLKLSSKPMYHQLPSDLTPPKEQDVGALPPKYGPQDRPLRPPWDPRPGHFYSGKPEYLRPNRPHPEVAYKRIDKLPNILPQFRPNTKHHYSMNPPPHLNRQPLLERPSNRPIGFFDKIAPPVYKRYPPPKNILQRPPPPHIDERRPLPPQALTANFDVEERLPLAQQPQQNLDENHNPMAEDRIINEDARRPELVNNSPPELSIYQTPPNIPNIHIANRRNGDGDVEIETLQMIQAKNEKENGDKQQDTVKVVAQDPEKDTSDKTIYKVYPVNTAPVIDAEKTPTKHESDFSYAQKNRNDAPILRPHPRPSAFPVKSDFPYPLERPDLIRHPESQNNKLDDPAQDLYKFNNQWNSLGDGVESKIVSGGKINYASNQISATLKTYTEKPIAIAYTPTEPNLNADRYSMPNYGSPVIPEIRPGTVESADTGYGSSKNSEITVHAVMHANQNVKPPFRGPGFYEPPRPKPVNHKIDIETGPAPPQLDFQAPFQASVKLDAATNHGWSVVKDKNKTTTAVDVEATTLPLATTSEFDIENFKPQLIGGFQPLYTMPDLNGRKRNEDIAEREE